MLDAVTTMHTGRCHCEQVRFAFIGAPSDASFCHCSICRRLTGSAFGAWCEVPGENFRWLAGQADVSAYRPTDRLETFFCRTCGVTVLASHDSWPGFRYIPLGTLDDGERLAPKYHQFTGSKALWYRIHGPLPQYEAWPEDGLMSCGWGAVEARGI